VGSPVTITSVTPQTLSACSGGTDSITVVASVASTASSYAFSSGTGASFLTIPSPTTLTTVVNGSVDDGSNPVTPSPTFSFPFAGVNYTDFNVNTNGWMKMLTAAPATNIPSSLTSIGSTTGIFMFGRDANLNTANGGSITHGATAGGKYVIQFNNNSGGGGGVASATSYVNAQIVLWGSTSSSPGKIEIIYGTSIGTPGSNGTIGIVDIANTYMNAVTGNSIATTTVSTWPASGTMYTFTPPTLTYAWTSLNPSNTLINTTLPTTVATITDTGKFQIVVSEAGGCSALDSTVKIFLGGGNPNITAMNTTNNSYCYTDSTTLSTTVLGGCPPYTYSWSGGLGSTASVKAKPTTTTKYYVTVTDNNTNVDIDSITVTIISPQILTVLGDTICGTDTARLSATANTGDSIVWYRSATGTNIVKFGANLDTVLSANDTFYVGATVITGTNTYNVGPPARVAALNYFISNNWGITFNASEPCVINSVAIYPSTAGIISIRAQSSMTTPTIFGTYSMNITAGQIGTKVIVPVNFVIPTAGTGYKMIVEAATTVTGLHRETPPAPGFAYSTVGSPISLPSSEWGGTTTGTYYFFYDWSVTKTTYCQSPRTQVVVIRNTPPTISASAPSFICAGGSVALNVASPNDPNYTYTWNPGSLSGASQTVTPGSTTTYTVNAFDATTGCRASKDTIVVVRPYPTKPVLNVDSVYLCNGTVQPLNITNGFNSGTASATSGTISLAIPDNSATGISSILNLSTVPTGATIDSVAVTFNLNHAYLADAEVTLTAPNGKVIALAADQGPSGTGSYVNTRISSNSANPALSSTSTPISGTYRANATVAGSLKGSFGANLTSTFSDLFTTANGNWTLTAFDDAGTDLGTLTSYSIDIYYRNTTSYSWTPTASLYTNAPATNGYTSGDSLTLYAKNTVNTNYISTATLNGCSTSDTAKYVIKSSSSSIALFSASTNGSPLTLDCEDAGWTYYADPSNNNRWLFGIDWDTNIVAKSTAQIVLDYNTTGVIKDVKQRPGSSADYDGAYIMRRYWNVNNATLNAGSTPVKIRFFYDPADTTAARDSMDVNRVAYATASPGGNPYYATPWKWFKTVGVAFTPALINDGNNFSFSNIELTPSAMSTLNGVSYVQFDNITSFSGGSGGIGFTPHSGGVGLPVTLVSFAGNVEEAHNHIQWTTASELNNDHFELESSVDGKNFTTLATISGHGTTTETHQYSFNDYKYNMPSTYYRLKQVDFDGKSTTTNMIVLTRTSNVSTSAVVSVYPNPTNDITTLSIDVQENTEAMYTIHDISGKIVSEGAINCIAGMNNTTIQTGDLADGMYIVDVLINGKHINTRLVKSTK
jgi:subtilisin-like proprotein convertase family protein